MNDPALSSSGLGLIEDNPATASPFRTWKSFAYLRKYWWLPTFTTLLGLGAAVAFFLAPPTYVSEGRLWETEKLRLPEGATFTGDLQNYYGTQMELLESGKLEQLAIDRLQASGTNKVPRDAEGKPLKIKVTARQAPKSTVFFLQASSGNAAYSQAFLDALMSEYVTYKKNVRKVVSGDTLNSVSEQVLRVERELKEVQEAFTSFQQSNNLAILREEAVVAVDCLKQLSNKLSDLQLEGKLLALSEPETSSGHQVIKVKMEHIRNTVEEWQIKLIEANNLIAKAERLRLNVTRSQGLFDRLNLMLQNLDISRNIDLETMAILEAASPAERTYTREKRALAMGGFGGLGLGLGGLLLVGLYRAAEHNPPKSTTRIGQDTIKSDLAGRLEQIKRLHESGLLSKDAYDRKVEQILTSI
jgi:uncharacterized protein involved in exopolysaccharide biosynthesis